MDTAFSPIIRILPSTNDILKCFFIGAVTFSGILFMPPRVFPAETLRILFVGDLMVHKRQLESAWDEVSKQYDFTAQFQEINPYLKGDLIVGNLETVLGGEQLPYAGYPSFNSPDSFADSLKKAGFNVLLLANNHILDQGPKAALRTRQILMRRGFNVTGIFPCGNESHANAPQDKKNIKPNRTPGTVRPQDDESPAHALAAILSTPLYNENGPLLINAGGAKIGILNYTYGTNAAGKNVHNKNMDINIIDFDRIKQDIFLLRNSGAEVLIGAFHWGIEYDPTPADEQIKLAEFCLANGIDLVIGAHPHVLQPLEMKYTSGKPQCVAWSLGNFISNQREEPRDRSIVLAADFRRDVFTSELYLEKISVMPTVVEEYEQCRKKGLRVTRALKSDHPPVTQCQVKSNEINNSILKMLSLEPCPTPDGFYAFFERTPEIEQLLFAQKCGLILKRIIRKPMDTAD